MTARARFVARGEPKTRSDGAPGSAANWTIGYVEARPGTTLCGPSPAPEINANAAPKLRARYNQVANQATDAANQAASHSG